MDGPAHLSARGFNRFTISTGHDVMTGMTGMTGMTSQPPKISLQAQICNERKKAAKEASDASDALFKAVYILEHGPFYEDALVYKVRCVQVVRCVVLFFVLCLSLPYSGRYGSMQKCGLSVWCFLPVLLFGGARRLV